MYRKKISKKDLERLQRLRLMDDDFMTTFPVFAKIM